MSDQRTIQPRDPFETYVTRNGESVRGFVGLGSEGQVYLACPDRFKWTVYRCDKTIADRLGTYTPAEFNACSYIQGVKWADDGNGIDWYSFDMTENATDRIA